MNEDNDAPFVDRPRRDMKKWKGKSKGDGFAHKAKKNWKNRERELDDEDDERELREYR